MYVCMYIYTYIYRAQVSGAMCAGSQLRMGLAVSEFRTLRFAEGFELRIRFDVPVIRIRFAVYGHSGQAAQSLILCVCVCASGLVSDDSEIYSTSSVKQGAA